MTRFCSRMLACTAIIASVTLFAPLTASAGNGQDFPDWKCTCVDCNGKDSDIVGQCASVCKDKTVFAKGSETYDYCRKDNVAKGSDKSK
jgi:hypothetical protein